MTSQTYPSGKVIGYEYDDKGELVSMSIDGVPFISNIKTNDNGLLSYEYADGTKHTRAYDTNGRVTKLSYPNYTEEVNYNPVSNITNVKADNISRAFGYDNLDRLTSYEQNATDFQNFVYDANGNRLNQNQENNNTSIFTYAQNSNILNSMVESNTTESKTINYEYDATGNIIKDDKHTYTYDSRNRLTAIDSNVTYQYNYDNKRVSKTVNGVKTYFIYEGHMLIGEYKLNLSDDSRQEYVYLNSTPIAVIRTNDMGRVYADHLNTPRRVATNDEDATIVWKWESKPFGETEATGEITFNLRFPGQYYDSETKTHYNINRDYNPVTGRYIQSDPIGFDGGVNGFAYVGGSPILYIDPNGHFLIFAGAAITGAIPGVPGLNGQAGVFWDYTTDKMGLYTAPEVSLGVDASAGGVAGVIYGDTSLQKFQGSAWSANVGILIFTMTSIYDMDDNWIGNAVGIDAGPLPASATIDFSHTVISETITSRALRTKIYDALWDIYDTMLSVL